MLQFVTYAIPVQTAATNRCQPLYSVNIIHYRLYSFGFYDYGPGKSDDWREWVDGKRWRIEWDEQQQCLSTPRGILKVHIFEFHRRTASLDNKHEAKTSSVSAQKNHYWCYYDLFQFYHIFGWQNPIQWRPIATERTTNKLKEKWITKKAAANNKNVTKYPQGFGWKFSYFQVACLFVTHIINPIDAPLAPKLCDAYETHSPNIAYAVENHRHWTSSWAFR